MIKIKRISAPAEPTDGIRILVDRLWPSGIARADVKLDDWMKEISPSDRLRIWFGDRTDQWDEFVNRYQAELQMRCCAEFLDALMLLSLTGNVTLLYGARSDCRNNAAVIRDMLCDCWCVPATGEGYPPVTVELAPM